MLTTLGGLALFLLGIDRIAKALQALSGPRMRRAMSGATKGPWRALLTGSAVSAATQSGTATAVTTLGLVATGLVAVREGIAMSLGSKVGATLAIQLAAFDVAGAAIPLVGIGFVLASWKRTREIGGLLIGAGLLFFGLDVTVGSVSELRSSELFALLVETAERQPLAVALVGAVLGALLSSTNGVTAVALGLYAAGGVALPTALALVVGGNVGGTVLPLLAARNLDVPAQRVALMHIVAKAIGAVAVVAAAAPVATAIAALGGDGARQIANAHTLFNVAIALPGTLLAGALATLAARLLPQRDEPTGPKYLRSDALERPSLAIALVQRESVRISDQVMVMTELAVDGLKTGQWSHEPIGAREAKVDALTVAVVDYLATLRRRHGEDAGSERLLLVATELEHMGDQIRRMLRREERLRDAGLEFSREGREELVETGARVLHRMRGAFTALATGDPSMADEVLDGRPDLERWVARMRVAHLSRLEAQLPESRGSSSHHLELLTLLRQLDASVTRIAGWARGGLDRAADAGTGTVRTVSAVGDAPERGDANG
ncbi:MAG: Na/Pi symporter [Trueperaceae bacterium]